MEGITIAKTSRIVLLIFILLGCPRKLQKAAEKEPDKLLPASADNIIEQLRQRYAFPVGSIFRLKYQAQYDGDRKQNFQLRIIGKDSLLWMSAGFMGLEGLRLLWRQDSIFILNRLTKEAYLGPVDSLRGLFPPVGAADFLALLLGYWPPSMDGVGWSWLPQERRLKGELAAFHIEAQLIGDMKINTWQIATAGESFLLSYDYAGITPKLPYPKLTFFLPGESQLILTPREVEYNPSDAHMPFTIPEGYTVKPLHAFGF